MLRHIVMWKFNEGVDKQIIGEEIKSSLLDLCKSMDEVVKADVVYNVLPTSTHDLVLILDVNDEDALNKYATIQELQLTFFIDIFNCSDILFVKYNDINLGAYI